MKKRFSLRNHILITLIAFVLVLLGLIYLFQTVFLDDFYKANKIKQIKTFANEISENITSNDIDELIDKSMLSGEVCVRIVSNNYYLNRTGACALKNLDAYSINEIASDALRNNGEVLYDDYVYNVPDLGINSGVYIFGKYITINHNDILILVSSLTTPLNATIQTLNNQYILIVGIVIVLTIILAFILSRFILKPIKTIESEAKNLPIGKYDEKNVKTRVKELEELNTKLEVANEQILAADKTKKELLANVSHDLRTPLTMIVGYGEMIKDFPEESNEENINVIIDEAKRLSSIVDDLLDVSRIDNNQFELNKNDVSLYDLLNSVYEQYKNYCKSNKIKLKLNITKKEYKDVIVNVDENRIKQVLYNFINNSINHNSKSKQEIEIGVDNNDVYRVYVLDNGDGISELDLENIWDRYYKVDKDHKRSIIGSGIGLALAKQLLVKHELNYGVESKVNEYSKFYFDIKKKI